MYIKNTNRNQKSNYLKRQWRLIFVIFFLVQNHPALLWCLDYMLWWWYVKSAAGRCFTPLVPHHSATFTTGLVQLVLQLACFLKLGRKWTCLASRQMNWGRASTFSLLGDAPRRMWEWEDEDRQRQLLAHLLPTSLPLHFLFPSLPCPPLLPLTLLLWVKKQPTFVTEEKCMQWQGISHCFCVMSPSPRQASKDPLFLTGVTFPSEYPASPETLVKLSVYDSKDKSQELVSVQLPFCACFMFPYFGWKERCVFLCQWIEIEKWSEAHFSFVPVSNVGNLVLGFWLCRDSTWKAAAAGSCCLH